MESELRVNTLKDAAGNNSIATSFVAGGSAKAWVRYNASSGTPSVNDSLNVSSMSDVSAGKHSYSFSSSFGNANYAFTAGGSNVGTDSRHLFNNANAPATGSFQFVTIAGSTAATDGTYNATVFHGDLA